MNAIEVGQRIKKFRENKDMTQNKLATKAGVSPTYIYKVEKGERCPTVEFLEYICFGLGISLADFFNEPADAPSKDKVGELSLQQKRLLNDFLNSL